MSCKSRIEVRAAPSCAGLTRASISFSRRVFAKQMDCRVEPGNDTPRAALALALVFAGMLSVGPTAARCCATSLMIAAETFALGADDRHRLQSARAASASDRSLAGRFRFRRMSSNGTEEMP